MTRLKELFTDGRTWTALMYMVLMLPLGILYFCVAIALLSTSLGLIASPLALFVGQGYVFTFGNWNLVTEAPWLLPLFSVIGFILLFATLHLARAVGLFHGWLAKHLLVRTPVV